MDWHFKKCHSNDYVSIGEANQTLGDAFSPPIPADKLSTLNWNTKGLVKLYAADMTFLGDYGPGERMLVPEAAHRAMGKAVLIAASPDITYYCMSSPTGAYLDGEIITLAPNEMRTFTGLTGKSLFVTDGALTDRAKHALLKFETIDTITLTASTEGAMLVLFWSLP
jgi:hypothetical protein